jgi:sigma-B regulation protein RsbU (phosphoserine phosphatase)
MTELPRSIADSLHALIHRQRELAYLQIDAALTLKSAGGHLDNYGLGDLKPGEPVCERAFFLEGLLPPVETPQFIRSMEVVSGRAADLQLYLDGGDIWVVLLDVTAERDETRRIQQRAYDMTLLNEKEAQLNRRLEAANAALRETQRELESSRADLQKTHAKLQGELAEAASYVRSLLPPPQSRPFAADWRFVPSADLGGDGFGYHWIDSDHFAMYLLDVCGHGVGPSLMSVAVLHALRSATHRAVDFRRPAQVLESLNAIYQMENSNDLYFTIWYGVYRPADRQLEFACAGHPPALLIDGPTHTVRNLKVKGVPIGFLPQIKYESSTMTIPPNARLYLLSDGTYEIEKPDGGMLSVDDLAQFLRHSSAGAADLDEWWERLLKLHGGVALEDDYSIVRFHF